MSAAPESSSRHPPAIGERGDVGIAGFVLAGASLVVPPSAVPALIVGAIAVARGQVVAGAAIMWLAAALGASGALIWYDALNLAELFFYPEPPPRPPPIPFAE